MPFALCLTPTFLFRLLRHGLIQNLEPLVELLIRNHQRDQMADDIAIASGRKHDQTLVITAPDDGFGQVAVGFGVFLVHHDLHAIHGAQAPDISDEGIFFVETTGTSP